MRRLLRIAVFIALLAPVARSSAQPAPARVTILYDAIGKSTPLKHGWGYSALIEYGGRRILFDTGGRVDDFASNVNALGVDLGRLDFVVLSHRHGDHTSGLNHVLKVNPRVTIYTPAEQQNFHTPSAPALVNLIRRRVETAPEDMHYSMERCRRRSALIHRGRMRTSCRSGRQPRCSRASGSSRPSPR